jgi:hypothetical protein
MPGADPVPPIVPPVPDATDRTYGQAFAMGMALERAILNDNGPIRAVIRVEGFRRRRETKEAEEWR